MLPLGNSQESKGKQLLTSFSTPVSTRFWWSAAACSKKCGSSASAWHLMCASAVATPLQHGSALFHRVSSHL